MKKFFILILSVILCAENPVFAMDPEQYNEEYSKLPTLCIGIIEHPLSVEDFKKVNLQEYVQENLNKNLFSSEMEMFELHKNFNRPTNVPESGKPEPDDLDSWEDLGSSFPPQGHSNDLSASEWTSLESSSRPHELPPEDFSGSWVKLLSQDPEDPEGPPEDLLSAQIFYSDSAPQTADFLEWKKSLIRLGS